jgi:IS30 family transposase
VKSFRQLPFRTRAKIRMAEQGLSVAQIAREIGKRRETASRAINRGHFPHVRHLIAQFLKISP